MSKEGDLNMHSGGLNAKALSVDLLAEFDKFSDCCRGVISLYLLVSRFVVC